MDFSDEGFNLRFGTCVAELSTEGTELTGIDKSIFDTESVLNIECLSAYLVNEGSIEAPKTTSWNLVETAS